MAYYNGKKILNTGAVPEGYIKPSGSIELTENGTHNVKQYENVIVNVVTGGGAQPKLYAPNITRNDDTLIITDNAANGLYVSSYDIYVDGVFVKEYPIHSSDVLIGTWKFNKYVDFKTLVNRGICFYENFAFYRGSAEYYRVRGPWKYYPNNGNSNIYYMSFDSEKGESYGMTLGSCSEQFIQTTGDQVITNEPTITINKKQGVSADFWEWFCNSAVCETTNVDLTSLGVESGSREIQVVAKGANFIGSELSEAVTWQNIAGASEVPVTMSAASSYGGVSCVVYKDVTYEGAGAETFTAYAGTELYVHNNTGSQTVYINLNGEEVAEIWVLGYYTFLIPTNAISISIQTGETTYITYTTN